MCLDCVTEALPALEDTRWRVASINHCSLGSGHSIFAACSAGYRQAHAVCNETERLSTGAIRTVMEVRLEFRTWNFYLPSDWQAQSRKSRDIARCQIDCSQYDEHHKTISLIATFLSDFLRHSPTHSLSLGISLSAARFQPENNSRTTRVKMLKLTN